ncbi:unnamed protein product [Somion occarium]|uniref:Protein kinase domain-containing protein n=1 Tax=Somion occarium TaxID=3059160 RepID=A0ABP1CRQ7_9APHY
MGIVEEVKATTSPPAIENLPELLQSYETAVLMWDTLHPWFETKGYVLYPRDSYGCNMPSKDTVYSLSSEPVQLPFAYIGDISLWGRRFNLRGTNIFPAIDSQHRDAIIKLLFDEDDEARIVKHLASEPLHSDPLNLTIPILDVLTYGEGCSFLTMPRWGEMAGLYEFGFDSFESIFDFVTALLKGLTFLHKNLIAHRDIKRNNILVNYYEENTIRDLRPFLASKCAKFVLCDFGISVMFSPDSPPACRVLPAAESEAGSYEYHPPDAANGETVYDPFAYDVACLGGFFCELIGYVTPRVPPLAPFLDRMIDPHIPSRYTAAEALEASIQLKDSFDPGFLTTSPPPPPDYSTFVWQAHDRWAGLPEEFVRRHTEQQPPVRPRRKLQMEDDTSFFVDWDVVNVRDLVL